MIGYIFPINTQAFERIDGFEPSLTKFKSMLTAILTEKLHGRGNFSWSGNQLIVEINIASTKSTIVIEVEKREDGVYVYEKRRQISLFHKPLIPIAEDRIESIFRHQFGAMPLHYKPKL